MVPRLRADSCGQVAPHVGQRRADCEISKSHSWHGTSTSEPQELEEGREHVKHDGDCYSYVQDQGAYADGVVTITVGKRQQTQPRAMERVSNDSSDRGLRCIPSGSCLARVARMAGESRAGDADLASRGPESAGKTAEARSTVAA